MSTIKQLSVFLENKFGRLNEVLDILGKANVDIIAASVADTSEYGILRMITSDAQQAATVLKSAHVSANVSEVIALEGDTSAASLSNDLKRLAQEGVSVEYMYCFSSKGKSVLIIRTKDQPKTVEAIAKHKIKLLTIEELKSI